jgi:uncharacterized protein (DUF4415 family)
LSGSSLREKQLVKSESLTKEERERQIEETLHATEAMKDDDIDFSDMPEVTNFSGWERGKFYRPVKDQVTLRLDRDVLNWFKVNHEKYQTAINEALREHLYRQPKTS